MEKIKNILEIASNIAVVLVSIVVLIVLAAVIFRTPPVPSFIPGLEKGKALGKLATVDYGSSEQRLLIALKTSCSHCEESLPLYRKLAFANDGGLKRSRVMAIFSERSEEAVQYLRAKNLDIDFVANVNFQSLRISRTPTMILVNRNGTVQDFWLGKPPEAEVDLLFRHLIAENTSSR